MTARDTSNISNELEEILAQNIQVSRLGRATDPKPDNKIWFTTQMQDLFVLETDAVKQALTAYLKQECDRARIDELERFEWNDPHMYVHTRLATLLKGEK